MVWAGSPFAHRVEFSAGYPTGAVSYRLLGNDGVTVLYSGEKAPDRGAVDVQLIVPAQHNTCALPLFENRTLAWDYITEAGVQSDRITYRVDRPLPFAVSAEGVRNKLGLSDHEIADSAVDLITAYSEILDLIGETALSTAAVAGDRSTLLVAHAIEATAGLALLPTLQLRAAQRESSGTNEYARYSQIDWVMLEANLKAHVDRARGEVDATFDATGTGGFVFGTAGRSPDAITGEEV